MKTAQGKPEWAQGKREKQNAERIAAGLKPKRRIMPWVVLTGVIIVIGGSVFMLLNPDSPAPVAKEEASFLVKQLKVSETGVIAPATLQQTVRVTGTFVPAHQASVAAQTSGRILTVLAQPGDRIAAGDIMAQIDTENLQIQLDQQRATAEATRAQLLSSRGQLERSEELARSGLTTPSALEQARSATAALEATLTALENGVKAAELALNHATVTAPIDGIVSVRSAEPGQTVAAGTPLFTLVDLGHIEFQASASVASSALIQPGHIAHVTVTGLDSQEFEGRVVRVNPVATPGTRAVPIYIMIENPTGMLRGGMFATGQIVVQEKPDTIAVPFAALREDAEGFHVLRLRGNTIERAAVERGTEWDRGRTVEVTGLQPGDRIVTAPLAQLADGETINLVED